MNFNEYSLGIMLREAARSNKVLEFRTKSGATHQYSTTNRHPSNGGTSFRVDNGLLNFSDIESCQLVDRKQVSTKQDSANTSASFIGSSQWYGYPFGGSSSNIRYDSQTRRKDSDRSSSGASTNRQQLRENYVASLEGKQDATGNRVYKQDATDTWVSKQDATDIKVYRQDATDIKVYRQGATDIKVYKQDATVTREYKQDNLFSDFDDTVNFKRVVNDDSLSEEEKLKLLTSLMRRRRSS